MNTADTKTIFVNFGNRALTCLVEKEEWDVLSGHALELARAAHVLQRVVTRFKWKENFGGSDRKYAGVGLDFINGMIAQMLEISKDQA